MTIIIPRQTSWNCPEGVHHVRLSEVIEISKFQSRRGIEEVRLVWEVTSLDDEWQYKVGKNYPAIWTDGSLLVQDLRHWFGEELSELLGPGRTLNLKSLIGRRADVVIQHRGNDSHAKPFCVVVAVGPKNSFDVQAVD